MANDTSYGTAEQLRDPHYMPPLGQAVPLGIQHILAMFISNVTPAIIICGAAGFGFGLLFTPTAPCAPPRSIERADRARGTECLHPMPVPGSAHTSPSTPTARTCERACCCCADDEEVRAS